MRKSTGSYPSLIVDTTAKRVVSHAGAVVLAATENDNPIWPHRAGLIWPHPRFLGRGPAPGGGAGVGSGWLPGGRACRDSKFGDGVTKCARAPAPRFEVRRQVVGRVVAPFRLVRVVRRR